MATNQAAVQKRLMRDYREMMKMPLRTVSAAPLENNLFVWHANLMGILGGPYEGAVFHMVIRFPQEYPKLAPSIKPLTTIRHPNVFGDWICLNILESGHGQYEVDGQGWSSAYTISTVLMQLQTFLLNNEDVAGGFYGHYANAQEIQRCILASQNFHCRQCGHSYQTPYPPFMEVSEDDEDDGKSLAEINGCLLLETLQIMKNAETRVIEKNLLCYHSKLNYLEDVLGLGVSVEMDTRAGRIAKLNSPVELLSQSAFFSDKIRIDAFKEMKFEFWMPIYINSEHFDRGFDIFKESVTRISASSSDMTGKPIGIKAVDIICKLMNSMVVNMMSEKTHASIKALEGFCLFHRLLIEVIARFPYTKKYIDSQVRGFNQRYFRHKKNIPVLGEWLNLLSVSSVEWEEVSHAYLEETFARNVMWTFRKYPELENHKGMNLLERANRTFEAQKVSMHLLCFHVVFLRYIGRPDGMSLKQVKERYDRFLGFPSSELTNMFQKYCKEVKAIRSFPGVYACLSMNIPSLPQFKEILDSSIEISIMKGYHRPSV